MKTLLKYAWVLLAASCLGQAVQINPNKQIRFSTPIAQTPTFSDGLNLSGGPLSLTSNNGLAGQALISQGNGVPPTWGTPMNVTPQFSNLIVIGDSTSCGAYGNNINNNCYAATNQYGWTYWMNQQYPAGVLNFGVGGSYITDINQFQLFPQGVFNWGAIPPAVLDTGLNDRNYTTTYQQNTIFQPAHLAALYRREITAENWIPAG